MVLPKKLIVAPCICFCSTHRSWLNYRHGRVTRYADSASLCTEMIGSRNFDKLDHLQQLLLLEMCDCIRKKLSSLSIQYSLDQTLPRLDHSDIKSLIKKRVTFSQYRAFLWSVLSHLLPHKLVGRCNMQLAVDRISHILFKLGFDESIRLCDLYSISFKTSMLKWAKHLPSNDLCGIQRKFLLWLLELCIHVTRAAFYVTPENRTKHLCFYQKNQWKCIETYCFRLLIEKRNLKKVKDLDKSAARARVRFIPKKSVTRSLIVSAGDAFLKRYLVSMMKIVSVVLDLVCSEQRKDTNGSVFTGAAIWNGTDGFPKRFRKFTRMNASSRIYAVKTDIKECFDCINQNLLLSILRKRILNTSHFRLHADAIGMNYLIFARQNGFTCGLDYHNCNLLEVCVSGEMVLRFIETHVVNTEFEYRTGVYRAYRGIPQGSHASTRLCNLYLGAADCERFAELMKRRDTLLVRYVDDYLLLTTELNIAHEFLKIMHFGVNDGYNIIAESKKTVINFFCERDEVLISGKMVGPCSAIPWCGYIIYPGLKKYCIDWAKMHTDKAVTCRIVHRMNSREKRSALLKFLKISLLQKYRLVHRLPASKWRIKVLKKFASVGIKLYARPYANKLKLSTKGRWNRIFWQKLRNWLRQGFKYAYNTRLAHLFALNSPQMYRKCYIIHKVL